MSRTPRPEDFFSEKPPARIIATETECNPQVPEGLEMTQYIGQSAVTKAGYKSVASGNWRGLFLENGFGLYVDVGHLEVAAPEGLGPRQAAAADLAGILLLASIVEASGLPHRGIHRHSGTIIGSSELTSGHHQNFLIPRSLAGSKLMHTIMASHFTSDMWSMSGTIKNGFQLSQKVKGIADPPITLKVERRTDKNNKPMAMIPPVKDDATTVGSGGWARLERRYADAGFSPTSRFLGMAATSLALRLLEHRRLVDIRKLNAYSFRRFAASARLFNEDLSFTATAETRDKGRISAVDYQEIEALACLGLSEEIELPEDERIAIELWLTVCDELRKSDLVNGHYGKLITMLDFAPRHRYLTARFKGDALSSSNPHALEANLTWDRILQKGGGMTFWEKIPSRYVLAEDVKQLLRTPPRETRAASRGRLIADPEFEAVMAKWTSVVSRQGEIVELQDPYNAAA